MLQGLSVLILPQKGAAFGQPSAAHMQRIVDVQDVYLAGSAQPQNGKVICKGQCIDPVTILALLMFI